jgi:rRNA pseudouridine-1189 N-methylase Emg1 (Nep1/Mra1 family)
MSILPGAHPTTNKRANVNFSKATPPIVHQPLTTTRLSPINSI